MKDFVRRLTLLLAAGALLSLALRSPSLLVSLAAAGAAAATVAYVEVSR